MTFLFTDIEGSTRLLRQLGPERYAEALAEHRRVLRAGVRRRRRRRGRHPGRCVLRRLPDRRRAPLRRPARDSGNWRRGRSPCAWGFTRALRPSTSEGYVGIDVHRGARVAALAHGGQVILSRATAALVDDEPLRDLGRHRLKDFDAPAQLFQLGTGEFPPLRTPGAVDLPTPATRFLGREHELFEAATLWLDRDPRVLTIVGPGGTGKTRFSIELARLLAEEADGGTVFVPLAPVRDRGARRADDRRAVSAPRRRQHAAIAARLGEKRAHVVLDNLEQLLPAAARPLAELLAAAPGLRLVATSREPLRIAGESEFDLPPMDETEAVTLFLERAQAIRADVADSAGRPRADPTARRPPARDRARRRPRQAARPGAAAASGSVSDSTCSRAAATSTSGMPRCARRSRGATTCSDAEEQRLFARLAVFRGGCSLDDAETVCEADLDTLASLLDKSLVRRRTEADGDRRFWMLETIREFASERLDASGDEHALRQAQAVCCSSSPTTPARRAIVDTFHPGTSTSSSRRSTTSGPCSVGARPRSGAGSCSRRLARGVLGRPRPPRGRVVARATARRGAGSGSATSRGCAYGRSAARRHLRRAGTSRALLSREPELFEFGDDEMLEAAHIRFGLRGEHGHARRRPTPPGPSSRSLSRISPARFRRREGQVTRVPRPQGVRGRGSRARRRAGPRERCDRARGRVAWWEAGHLDDAASIERERGNLETAEATRRRAL